MSSLDNIEMSAFGNHNSKVNNLINLERIANEKTIKYEYQRGRQDYHFGFSCKRENQTKESSGINGALSSTQFLRHRFDFEFIKLFFVFCRRHF